MITYNNLLLSLSKILKENFPKYKIMTDENKKAIIEPTFYIQVVPLKNNLTLTNNRIKLTDVYITFIKKDITNQEKLNILDDLVETIEVIGILDLSDKTLKKILRYLPVIDKSVVNSDNGMPSLKITLKYYDERRKPVTDVPSQEFDDYMRIIEANIYANGSKIHTEIKED